MPTYQGSELAPSTPWDPALAPEACDDAPEPIESARDSCHGGGSVSRYRRRELKCGSPLEGARKFPGGVLHRPAQALDVPAGTPHLQNSSVRFVNRMSSLLEVRESVTLGVARHRLVIESVTTDPNNALLRELAHRLHRTGLRRSSSSAAQRWKKSRCANGSERGSAKGDGPIGRRLDKVGPWDHIRLRARDRQVHAAELEGLRAGHGRIGAERDAG